MEHPYEWFLMCVHSNSELADCFKPMSIHCSQGTWRAVGCPHHLHPMQRMQAAASRRHATGQKHVVQGTQKKRFCFWLSIFSCFATRKNITVELRRNFQLINWLSKKEQKQKGNGAHRRPQCQKQPPNCSEGTSKQLANCGFPIELHALKKPRALFTAIWRAACFAYSMLQGLIIHAIPISFDPANFIWGPNGKPLFLPRT